MDILSTAEALAEQVRALQREAERSRKELHSASAKIKRMRCDMAAAGKELSRIEAEKKNLQKQLIAQKNAQENSWITATFIAPATTPTLQPAVDKFLRRHTSATPAAIAVINEFIAILDDVFLLTEEDWMDLCKRLQSAGTGFTRAQLRRIQNAKKAMTTDDRRELLRE